MDNSDSIYEPDDREIDMMLKYVPEYSEANARNIKNKFIQKAKPRHRKFSLKKLTLITAAAFMILITTLVYAEVLDISKIYRIIFGENSENIEQYIEPLAGVNDVTPVHENHDEDESVNLLENEAPIIQSEYDGIVIKLISAINDENVLRIFATITDTKGDRLGESLDFASWGLSQGYGGNVSVVDYNNEAKTAILVITSLGNDHQGSVTLTVNDLSTGRELFENLLEININIGELLKGHTPNIISMDEVWKRGGSGDGKLYEESRLLKSDEIDIQFDNVDMFSISNIGFVDGLLHIQAKAAWSDTTFIDAPYINAKFVNSEKEIIYDSTAHIDFITDRKYAYESYAKEPHDEYIEMIYEGITSPEQLNNLSLSIDYMKPSKITEGKWEFLFVIPEKVTTEFRIDREIYINGEKLRIDMVSLSPLGITVHLPQDMSADYNHSDTAYVEYRDGTIIELDQPSIHTYESESTLIFGGHIIEIENVQDIIINGEIINISR